MGLDMWLEGKYYSLPLSGKGKQIDSEKLVKAGIIPEAFNGATEIVVKIAQWDDAYCLQDWLQNNFDTDEDGSLLTVEISPADIRELVSLCWKVVQDPLNAKRLLPNDNDLRCSDITYDVHYFDIIRQTIEQLEPVLDKIAKLEKDGVNIIYEFMISQ